MSTEPVRVSIEVTWWPASGDWGISRRGWRRDATSQWVLEEMSTSGSPLTRSGLIDALDGATAQLITEVLESDDPFSTTGAFH
jgi:hypothetical protein